MVVAGMAAHNDISKAHEVANEVRRIQKQLVEAQTWATTYNNRERLFGMPVTNVSVKLDFLIPFLWCYSKYILTYRFIIVLFYHCM